MVFAPPGSVHGGAFFIPTKINLHKNLHGNFGRFTFVLTFTKKVKTS